ncbi:MAG: ATP-dependent metallopeptidase FtsH/Yme1/Tma family protein [Candidatus Paracaedibacteraceae bacterium]|nr:ATP-dependent metallopeptidase FtsH/Yme1/Tma family protein [Candidatus Paracaedibacteraceae bacterium]
MWVAIVAALLIVLNLFSDGGGQKPQQELSYSEFLQRLDGGHIRQVTIKGASILGILEDGTVFKSYSLRDQNIIDRLQKSKIPFKEQPMDDGWNIWSFLAHTLPMIILIAIWIFALRQMQGGANKAMGFGRSKAKLSANSKKVTFADVAGVEEAKEELSEVVEFLRNPEKYQKLGGKIPRGVLLVGPPGTGKTLLARAVAGEANAPFFSISGSDFVEMFVGVGASRVRDMFEQGRKSAPCIIFIDEIDAVGRHRGVGYGGGNDEREQTLNQLLVEMDGFEENDAVIIIAATNRADVLDPALLRPGRFDRQVNVDLPDLLGREAVLKVHTRGVPIAVDVDLNVVARGTPGFSGADLQNLVNEAALLSARHNKKAVTQVEFEEARDKILMGPERKNKIMSDEERRLTAYHEGGHALVAYTLKDNAHPIHKATILPRGRALGMVQQLPEKDQVSRTFIQMKSEIAIYMGGRIAEEIIFGKDKVTSGAYSDIKGATRIAQAMVTEFGLTQELGAVHYNLNSQGYEPARVSQKTYEMIDHKVRELVDEGLQKAKEILTKNLKSLHALAESLLKYETLTGAEIADILEGKSIRQESEPVKKRRTKTKTDESTPPLGGGTEPSPQV